MKKFVFLFSVMVMCVMSDAQEPEKKKSSPPRSRGQERAINEIGVSVKSDPKKTTKAKATQSPAPKEEKKKVESTETKKPE